MCAIYIIYYIYGITHPYSCRRLQLPGLPMTWMGDGYFYDIQIASVISWTRTVYSPASPETWFCSGW